MGENKRRNELRGVVDEVTKKLVDEGKIIESGWVLLKMQVIPENAPQVQLDEMRMAFFAGAQHLFGSIMSALDEDKEPTEADLERMSKISDELDQFLTQFKLKHFKAEGSA